MDAKSKNGGAAVSGIPDKPHDSAGRQTAHQSIGKAGQTFGRYGSLSGWRSLTARFDPFNLSDAPWRYMAASLCRQRSSIAPGKRQPVTRDGKAAMLDCLAESHQTMLPEDVRTDLIGCDNTGGASDVPNLASRGFEAIT
jgi:hypothetical protein